MFWESLKSAAFIQSTDAKKYYSWTVWKITKRAVNLKNLFVKSAFVIDFQIMTASKVYWIRNRN
jgi:hypothetical protein